MVEAIKDLTGMTFVIKYYSMNLSIIIKKLFLEVLNKTAGVWKGDSWPETSAKRKQFELRASVRRKQLW